MRGVDEVDVEQGVGLFMLDVGGLLLYYFLVLVIFFYRVVPALPDPARFMVSPSAWQRQFWEQRVAVVTGRPFQIPLGTNEYDDVRIAVQELTPKRETVGDHRRRRRANFTVSVAAFFSSV